MCDLLPSVIDAANVPAVCVEAAGSAVGASGSMTYSDEQLPLHHLKVIRLHVKDIIKLYDSKIKSNPQPLCAGPQA